MLNLTRPTTAVPIGLTSTADDIASTHVGGLLESPAGERRTPLGLRVSPILRKTTRVRNARRCLKAYTRDIFDRR